MEGSFHLKNEVVVAKVNKASFMPYLHVLAVEAAVEGSVMVTQAQMYFRVAETGGILVCLPHGCLERIRKVQGKEKTGTAYVVDLYCKDLRTIRLGLPSKLQYKQFVSVLESLAYELEISQLFALKWQEAAFGTWRYDAVAEYERCGLHTGDYRLTSFNKSYSACDSYPQVLAVPALAKDELLVAVAQFRSRGRLPVATYRFAQTGAALYRCSQPLVGLKNTRCTDDEVLLSMMAALPAHSSGTKLHIMDARPKVAAVGNKFLGAGMEHVGPGTRYDQCLLEYMNIGNIHTMRGSLQKLLEALDIADARKQEQAIERSDWKEHISRILTAAAKISHTLDTEGEPVLVHCTDGWDRTAQLTCLTQLILDPFYRTLEGFAILVEKEWLSFGHKFAQRHGHGTFSPKFKDTQRAPIFLQFVDCCWQLIQQFPTSFEMNERALLSVVDACYSCLFGTFLCNTDQERRVLYKVSDGTVSLWSYLLHNRKLFSNPLFDTASRLRLQPKLAPTQMQIWRTLYCRYQWSSVNELVGLPMSTPDLTVLSFNCARLERALVELARASHSRPQPPSLSVATSTNAVAAAGTTEAPSRLSPPVSRLLVLATGPPNNRVSRSGSITMDEIEGSRKRWQTLEIGAPVSAAAAAGDDDEEEDEEDNEEDDDDAGLELKQRRGSLTSVSPSIKSDPVLHSSVDRVILNGTATVSPRRDISKRRGVKLDANDILEQMTKKE